MTPENGPFSSFHTASANKGPSLTTEESLTIPLATSSELEAGCAAPVGAFYHGDYHTLVVAPATSNTVAKCVFGISDTLATNVYAQAGKCRIPSIVFACDTAPEMETQAPSGMVKVYPRRIDLDNVEKLKEFEATTVVETYESLRQAVLERLKCVTISP